MKPSSVFRCQACGYQALKGYGRCPGCGEFNTMQEESSGTPSGPACGAARPRGGRGRRPVRLAEVAAGDAERTRTGIAELDRVLGGGLVAGSGVLVGGDPGVGRAR